MQHFTVTPEFLASQGLSPTFVRRFLKYVNKTDGCWLWTAHSSKDGYGRIWKGADGDAMILAHVASWIIHHGPIPNGICVLHNCPTGDNPACVNPSHLWLGTRGDNNLDRERKGRGNHVSGTRIGTHKLNESQVLEIRRIYAEGGKSQLNIGRMFGVSERAVFFIVHRIYWKHI